MEFQELNETQAFALTAEQVKERKKALLDSLTSNEVVRYAKARLQLKHVTELAKRPTEYYEFFWVERKE